MKKATKIANMKTVIKEALEDKFREEAKNKEIYEKEQSREHLSFEKHNYFDGINRACVAMDIGFKWEKNDNGTVDVYLVKFDATGEEYEL